MKKLILFALLIILGIGLNSCSTPPQQLVYQDVRNFRLFGLSLSPDVGMDLQFYNPNNFNLSLKDAKLDVFINERQVGTTTLTSQFSVPAVDTFLMPVRMKVDLTSLFANAYSILSNREVDLRIVGNVKAGRGIYLNIPINFRTRQKLNVVNF
jgi:LEA14-like dessication related protein